MHVLGISSALIAVAVAEPAPFVPLPHRQTIRSAAINEASGLAASGADPNFLWVVNDSGASPEVHLIGTDGSAHGGFKLKGARNIDWEDLAGFTLGKKNYLLIADTGDNDAKRESRTLYIVPEPALPADAMELDSTIAPEWQIEFQYEGGPRDCEAVAVDPVSERVILVTKRTTPPEVYLLPLRPAAGLQTARKVGVTEVRSPIESQHPFPNQPTGLAITRDGSKAAIVTYCGVFLFSREQGENWEKAFGRNPIALAPHQLPHAEAVTFSRDGKFLSVISEGLESPIARYEATAASPRAK